VDDKKRKRISMDMLLNKQIVDIGRTGNVFWLRFTDTNADQGLEKNLADHIFTIEIFSDFRMIDKEKREVVFGSSDFDSPNSEIKYCEDFDLNVQGANQYDAQVAKWLESYKEVCVEKMKFNVLHDLRLLLSNGHILEIFVSFTSEDVCWRFFEEDSKRDHFVVTGKEKFFEYEAD